MEDRIGRLVDIDDVIRLVDKHTSEDNTLDNDISCILEEVQTVYKRPMELYAVEDCFTGDIIFNARGGCYREISDVTNKIAKLEKEKEGKYRVAKYKLTF